MTVKNQKLLFSAIIVSVLSIAIHLILLFYKSAFTPSSPVVISPYTTVERVIDGDTFILNSGIRVRLRGLEAPELGLCGSEEAKKFLETLVLGKPIVIRDSFTDKYGRVEGFVYQEDRFINEEMIASGWSRFDFNKSDQQDKLALATRQAQDNKTGVFSSLCYQRTNPDNPKCDVKGNISTKTLIKQYLSPGCTSYQSTVVEKDRGEQWFCSEIDAKKSGFVKSGACR